MSMLPAAARVSFAPRPAGIAAGPLRWSDVVAEWRPDPLMLALLTGAVAGYAWYRARGRRLGVAWTAPRDFMFGAGILAALWVSCGPAQIRATQLEWVWMAQLLALLLVVPFLVLAGQPFVLARAVSGDRAVLSRLVDSRAARVVGHPLVGPALVPVIFLVLLFGGVGQAAAASPPVGWLLHVVLLLLGVAIARPLIDAGESRTSLAVGMALAVGVIELVLDVFPGIALRLAGQPVIGYFAMHTPAWAGGWLYQQHEAGGLLWIASEVLDLPFVIFLAIRWVRVDAAETARIDAELDAADAAAGRAGVIGSADSGATVGTGPVPVTGRPVLQRPWFLDDPQLRDRYRS